jgi:NitT/TauT family transport system ATP-binding protein
MSAGPKAGIKSVYEVDLPRPRDEDTSSYVDLRHQIREDITVEVEQTLGVHQ